MKSRILAVALSLVAGCVMAGNAYALLDQFVGDTAIYGANSEYLKPNVLLIVDNSSASQNLASGVAYDPNTLYTGPYSPEDIYKAGQTGQFNTNQKAVDNPVSTPAIPFSFTGLTCTANNNVIKNTLLQYGTYTARASALYPSIRNNGACDNNSAYTYALGNYLNYTQTTPPGGDTRTQAQIVYDAIGQVVGGTRFAVNFGAMIYSQAGQKGAKLVAPIQDLSDDTAFTAFKSTLPGSPGFTDYLTSMTARPQAEALTDAGAYFRGLQFPVSGFGPYPSPITKSCDVNVVIIISNGQSNKDDSPPLVSFVQNYTHDADYWTNDFNANGTAKQYGTGGSHLLDDVARRLKEEDSMPALSGNQTIITNSVLVFQANDDLLRQTAVQGDGLFKTAMNANELAAVLTDMINSIVLEADTAFVAPVVPTSPENRTYSGERVYLGFFKPINKEPWHGNLKKYGISTAGVVIDANGDAATDDDGAFFETAQSFWSGQVDAGGVEAGGVGEMLLDRDLNDVNDLRLFYSKLGVSTDLTDSSNQFNSANVTPAMVGVADTATRDKLINYMQGFDVLDDNGDGSTTDKRNWIMGDILHSKPQIVNYNTYDFTLANESAVTGTGNDSRCTNNGTVVYVGANDGMLHAFRDCDGREIWAFVPPNIMANLNQLLIRPAKHTYFVDSSPQVWIRDYDNDGNIGLYDADSGSKDKVVLMFGLRRGGNAYYALDVTDPYHPVFMWEIKGGSTYIANDYTPNFRDLGETWSDPQIGTVKLGSNSKVVAFFGGGYDRYEDSRFGSSYLAPVAYDVPSLGTTPTTASSNTSSQWIDLIDDDPTAGVHYHLEGKALYAVQIADITNKTAAPDMSGSGTLTWRFSQETGAVNAAYLWYAFPSDVTILDTNYDGYTDRLYVGDLGGRMWRFDVGATATANWSGKMIFYQNGGEKIFYRPSVTFDSGFTSVYFGTGDREHPLNKGIVNRYYALKDRGQSYPSLVGTASPTNFFRYISPSSANLLMDLTTNELQLDTTSAQRVNEILYGCTDYDNCEATRTGSAGLLSTPAGTCNIASSDPAVVRAELESKNLNFGWYIRLNETPGEKVLAQPLTFNRVTYFTTYAPNLIDTTDPCAPGNLGSSTLYALNYLTGEAVLNFANADSGGNNNDAELTTNNDRAVGGSGEVLRRADRKVHLGKGIPSGLVMIMPASGDLHVLIGCGGGLCSEEPVSGGTVIRLYWRVW